MKKKAAWYKRETPILISMFILILACASCYGLAFLVNSFLEYILGGA